MMGRSTTAKLTRGTAHGWCGRRARLRARGVRPGATTRQESGGGQFPLGRGEVGEPGGATVGQTITCASENGRRTACPADTSNGVQLVRQLSGAKCKEGSSWGRDKTGIWVDKGCQAEFVVGVAGHPPDAGKGPSAKTQRVTCMSDDGRKNYCDADTQGAKVQLARQIGMAPCMEDSTWGYDRRGVWGDRGGRGEVLGGSGREGGAG